MSDERVPVSPALVEQLFQKLFPGGDVRSRELLGITTIAVSVWQFTLEASIEDGGAALWLIQRPRKKAHHNFVVRKKVTSDFRDIHAFASDAVQMLTGIAAALLVGIEGGGVDLKYDFSGSDDLIWDALKED